MKRLTAFLFVLISAMVMTGCDDSVKISVNEDIITEYGNDLDYNSLYNQDESDEGIEVKEVKGFDKYKLGEQEIDVTFTDKNNKAVHQMMKLNVKDTKYPSIKIKKDTITLTEGDKFDAAANIVSVNDPIDGEIKKAKSNTTENGYLINSKVDNKKAGSYTVDISAYDKNGNHSIKSYTVNVKAKPKAEVKTKTNTKTTAQASQSTPKQTKTNSTSKGSSISTASKASTTKTSTAGTNKKPAATTQKKPATTTSTQKKPTTSTTVSKPVGNKVYIAGSGKGKKYHSNPNCSNMSHPVEISLNDAKAQGYTACKKCY